MTEPDLLVRGAPARDNDVPHRRGATRRHLLVAALTLVLVTATALLAIPSSSHRRATPATPGVGAAPPTGSPGATGGTGAAGPTTSAPPTTHSPPLTPTTTADPDDPFTGAALYVPRGPSLTGVPSSERAVLAKVTGEPQAVWFGSGTSTSTIAALVHATVHRAQRAGQLPLLVAYNIPDRDCGGYSSGGADSGPDYLTWITQFAGGIGNAPAVVILEPDALASAQCLDQGDRAERYTLLSAAVGVLRAHPQTAVYLDAGNAQWLPAAQIAERLQWAGIGAATGFALNVSSFDTTGSEESYGGQISALLGGTHFVIDTSRNGKGEAPDNYWCNPAGRALGEAPTTDSGDPHVDALLWIKNPGASDGTCGVGDPPAGVFWPSYAEGLAVRADW